MKILILAITGMLGHKLFSQLSQYKEFDVYGTARSSRQLEQWFGKKAMGNIYSNIDAHNFDSLIQVFGEVKPDVVINCIGIIKQLHASTDPLVAINLNALLPHKIANLCMVSGTRMIGISTDCVFDGKQGNYTENDLSNASDLYGRTKFLGEVDYPHAITLRTSIIGHELKGGYGLIDWFMNQQGNINGYKQVIYSGFPTVELANIIAQYVIPKPELKGLYQVSAAPIAKYDLLQMVAKRYKKEIHIQAVEEPIIDRSLDSQRFRNSTGYQPPDWEVLVDHMADDYFNAPVYDSKDRQ
jgi:dTDP-4-dehydrorhamnose reductase